MKSPTPLSAEGFFAFFAGGLRAELQEDLDEYTSGEDIHGPYMPDYVPDAEEVFASCCEEWGLAYSGLECEADQGGYEESRRGRR